MFIWPNSDICGDSSSCFRAFIQCHAGGKYRRLAKWKIVIHSAENRWVRLLMEVFQERFLQLIIFNTTINGHSVYKQNGKFIDDIKQGTIGNREKGMYRIQENLIDLTEGDVMKFNSA